MPVQSGTASSRPPTIWPAQDVGDSGDYKVAETLFQKAIDLSEKSDGPTSVAYGTYLGNLADVYQNEQRYAEAEPLFLRMIAILQQHYSLDNPILDEIDVNIALFYFGWDKPDRAAPWFDRYISSRLAQWKANAWTMSEQDRLVYYATLPGTFPIYFSFVTKYHDRYPALTGKMYDALLAERGLVAESAASSRARLMASGNRGALSVLDRLAAEKAQFAALASSSADNRARISDLSKQINQTEEALAQVSGAYSQAKTLSAATWRDVQKALKPGEAAVEITKFQVHTGHDLHRQPHLRRSRRQAGRAVSTTCCAWRFETARSHAAHQFPFRRRENPRHYCRARGRRRCFRLAVAAPVNSSAAYDAFWKPLEPALAGVQRIYVAADGVLNQIPIGLLSDSRGKLLLEKYQLRYVNSTRDLCGAPKSPTVKSGHSAWQSEFRPRAAQPQGSAPVSSPGFRLTALHRPHGWSTSSASGH